MPDITISFTDAQWARIVAATASIKRDGEDDVDATYLSAKLKELVASWVQGHEQATASVDNWE